MEELKRSVSDTEKRSQIISEELNAKENELQVCNQPYFIVIDIECPFLSSA